MAETRMSVLASMIIGQHNMGYEITHAIMSPADDMYVTGYDKTRDCAVTWFASFGINGKWCYGNGNYFTASTNAHNHEFAVANMYKRAGYYL